MTLAFGFALNGDFLFDGEGAYIDELIGCYGDNAGEGVGDSLIGV